jgi:hypothetical protein
MFYYFCCQSQIRFDQLLILREFGFGIQWVPGLRSFVFNGQMVTAEGPTVLFSVRYYYDSGNLLLFKVNRFTLN